MVYYDIYLEFDSFSMLLRIFKVIFFGGGGGSEEFIFWLNVKWLFSTVEMLMPLLSA